MRESKGYEFRFETEAEINEFDRRIAEAKGFIYTGYIEALKVWKYRNNDIEFDIHLGCDGVKAVKIYKLTSSKPGSVLSYDYKLIEELDLKNVNNSVEFTNLLINKLK